MGQLTRILRLVLSAAVILALSSFLPAVSAAAEGEPELLASGEQAGQQDSKPKKKAKAKQDATAAGPAEANISLRLVNAKRGKAEIMSVVRVRGNLWPWVPGQRVQVQFFNNGKRVKLAKLRVRKGKGNYGVFEAAVQAGKPGKWAASAHHEASPLQRAAHTKRQAWRLTYPSLREGQCGPAVVGFKRAMEKMGYITNGGRCIAGRTLRGVHAYRKVNGMDRTFAMPSSLVKKVYRGKGAYKVRYPNAEGVHMEAPLDKQVLVFAKGSKPVAIYPVSSGAAATPTVRGSFRMQWTEPGYNSLGMYYSWYFYRGYAIHGYASVPTYPASHGCLRTFIADQPEIFNRIKAGDQIFIW
jgi:lipoprotein-anchoring transpeptidase ErfK/SrfK